MTSRNRRFAVVLTVAASLTLLTMVAIPWARSRVYQHECEKHLRKLWCVVELYQNNNHGTYPPNAETVLPYMGGGPFEFDGITCPGGKRNWGTTGRPSHGFDFIYIDWSAEARRPGWDPSKYPLVYDRSLANHEGRGINIVFADCSTLWDADAQWLRAFAAQHPEAKIPLPQGR